MALLRRTFAKAFRGAQFEPASPPDGTSVEERLNAWLQEDTERELVSVHYQFDGTDHCVLILYTE